MADMRLDALGTQREHQPLVAELALAPGDPLVVGEVAEVHLRTVRVPVPDRHRHIGRVVEDRRLHQAVGQRHRLVVPVEHDRQVEIATHHPGDPGLRLQLAGAHPQPGVVGAESGERGRKQPARGGRERRKPQLTHHLTALRLQVGLRKLDLGEDAGGMLGEQPPGVGEAHAPPVLGKQLLAHLALQLGHLLGDGRRRDVQSSAAPLTEPCRARASRVRRRSRFNI